MILLALSGDVLMLALLVAGPLMAFYGIYQLVVDLRAAPKRKVIGRLKGHGPGARGNAGREFNFDDLRKETPQAVGTLGKAFAELSFTQRLQTTLEQANISWSASRLLVNLTLIASLLLAGMVALKLPILAGLGTAVATFILPLLYLGRRRKKRLRKLVQQLPDVFELLSQALRAGHSLASGMQVISNEMPEPAGTEFARVFHEQNLGLKIEDALANLAQRMDVLDVRFFVTAVLIQRQTGGDLAEVLDKISSVIRDRIKLQGTVQALTAEGRLSGYVLLALPFLVFGAMLNINFEYAELLWVHPTGQMMSIFAIVSMLLGWVLIKKIINIKI
jgi:tight adherence protein B